MANIESRTVKDVGGYQGHVDLINKRMITGWALNTDRLDECPIIEIWQLGKLVAAVRPSVSRPNLLTALGLSTSLHRNSLFAWQIPFPLVLGISPDQPFQVKFAATGTCLSRGEDCVVPSVESIAAEVRRDLANERFLIAEYATEGNEIDFRMRCYFEGMTHPSVLLNGKDTNFAFAAIPSERDPLRFTDKQGYVTRLKLTEEMLHDEPLIFSVPPRDQFPHDRLRTVAIPRFIFNDKRDQIPTPTLDHIQRVSGPAATKLGYAIGGLTTFQQMDWLVRHHFKKSITDFDPIMDWGVGCARVLRHFLGKTRSVLIGADIDKVNLDWCRAAIGPGATFAQLNTELATLPVDDHSIDLLYGISVVTHLTEHHQFQWLEELRRVMRSGGAVILTVHGEYFYYQRPRSIFLPFVEQFGFFDGIPDVALGDDLSKYYRSTFHSRHYIRENWKPYFEIVDIIPGANAFVQDFVLMRAR